MERVLSFARRVVRDDGQGRALAQQAANGVAVVDAEGRPIRLKLTEGQAHDGQSAEDLLDTLGDGDIFLADRAYDADWLREKIAEQGAWANIRPLELNFPGFAGGLEP